MSQSLLVTDGDCGFCQRSANWLIKHFPGDWQNQPSQNLNPMKLSEFGLDSNNVAKQVWYLVPKVNVPINSIEYKKFGGAKAVGKLLLDQPKFYIKPFAIFIFLPPFSFVANWCYLWVAKNRGRFGKSDSCES